MPRLNRGGTFADRERVVMLNPPRAHALARLLDDVARVQIKNIGAEPVWLGGQGVSLSTGYRLNPRDGSVTFEMDDEMWGATNSRTYGAGVNALSAFVVVAVESVDNLAQLGKATP